LTQLTGAGFPGWAAFGQMPGLPDLGVAAAVATFFLDSGYRGTLNPLVPPGFIFGIFAGSIVLTWLYEGAGCSVLLVALWHTGWHS
jgi:hypothetical protein